MSDTDPVLVRTSSLVWGIRDWLGLGLQKAHVWNVLKDHFVTKFFTQKRSLTSRKVKCLPEVDTAG